MPHAVQDLRELRINEGVVAVALRMILDEDVEGLLVAVLREEPAGGLGDEPDEDELEQGGGQLQEGGEAPGPVVGYGVGAKRRPSRDDCAGVLYEGLEVFHLVR